mmetsp:Transcript_17996/g.37196  ORF Transcript_17996/g.37196 Transcript_17996/m.37196 type:complete len:271 (+) Transcript_17996:1630-2442(+)
MLAQHALCLAEMYQYPTLPLNPSLAQKIKAPCRNCTATHLCLTLTRLVFTPSRPTLVGNKDPSSRMRMGCKKLWRASTNSCLQLTNHDLQLPNGAHRPPSPIRTNLDPCRGRAICLVSLLMHGTLLEGRDSTKISCWNFKKRFVVSLVTKTIACFGEPMVNRTWQSVKTGPSTTNPRTSTTDSSISKPWSIQETCFTTICPCQCASLEKEETAAAKNSPKGEPKSQRKERPNRYLRRQSITASSNYYSYHSKQQMVTPLYSFLSVLTVDS